MITHQDFRAHNEEARAVWEAYRGGHPVRVPVTLWADPRFFILDEKYNPGERMSFRAYSEDAVLMMDFQLRMAEWERLRVAPCCDHEAGLPDKFVVSVDLQLYYDAGYFGAPVEYRPGQVPDTQPILAGDRRNLLFDRGLPADPLTGWGEVFPRALRLHEAMVERVRRGLTYRLRPVEVGPWNLGTLGPLTLATALRGPELYADFYADPGYVRQLLDFLAEALITRIRTHRRFFGLPEVSDTWAYADDAVQNLSTEMVRELVLPAHRKLKKGLTTAQRISVHLCGDSARDFRLLRDEMGVFSFDTGFPIDFACVRRELGPEVEIVGGPRVMLLHSGSPDEVSAECRRILQSGIMEGRFILREANDLVQGTPLVNLDAMYQAARAFGRYSPSPAWGPRGSFPLPMK